MVYQTQHCEVFALLPERKPPWEKFLFSLGTQSVVVLLAIWIALLLPHAMNSAPQDSRVVQLVEIPLPTDSAPHPIPAATQRREVHLTEPTQKAIRVPTEAKLPKPSLTAQPVPVNVPIPVNAVSLLNPVPIVPKPPVKTNVFSSGSSAPVSIKRAPEQVQTGGFGDSNGAPELNAQNKPVNIAHLGSFDLPPGAGAGNGTGGAQGVSGVVASSGFGNGNASPGSPAPNESTVRSAGFGSASGAQPTPASHAGRQPPASPESTVIPAEILFKPTPIYTDEARKLHVEGEVLLEVVFQASGAIRVKRVVRGLGHGLDEAAIHSAVQIRFKPAVRDGQPSDSIGILHIVFHLA